MAAVLSAMGSAQATPPPRVELPTLAKLIGQLREDAALRARFSLDPRSVFEETGVDPTPYDLPDRLDEDDVDRFLGNWTGARGPAAGSRPVVPEKLASESEPPAATPSEPHAAGDEEKIPPAPVAPVYGPPPGLRNEPPEPVSPPPPAPQPDEPQAPSDAQPSRRHQSVHHPVHQPAPVAPRHLPAFGPGSNAPVYGPPPGLRSKL
jgi:hypothetical protein